MVQSSVLQLRNSSVKCGEEAYALEVTMSSSSTLSNNHTVLCHKECLRDEPALIQCIKEEFDFLLAS
jgi:hypothetical protein